MRSASRSSSRPSPGGRRAGARGDAGSRPARRRSRRSRDRGQAAAVRRTVRSRRTTSRYSRGTGGCRTMRIGADGCRWASPGPCRRFGSAPGIRESRGTAMVRKGSPVRVRQRAPLKAPHTGPFSLHGFLGGGALPLRGPHLGRIPNVSAVVTVPAAEAGAVVRTYSKRLSNVSLRFRRDVPYDRERLESTSTCFQFHIYARSSPNLRQGSSQSPQTSSRHHRACTRD
jgi:hypothetical protein